MLNRFFFSLFLIVLASFPLFAGDHWHQTARSLGTFSLAGTRNGLFFIGSSGSLDTLWKGGEVKKIVTAPYGLFLLTDQGIFFTEDLRSFKPQNEGLNIKTIKIYKNGEKSFIEVVQDLKDLEFDPANPSNLITCSKDGVFYSLNAGKKWHFLPNPTTASGIKAVAVVSSPDTIIYMAHPFKGVFKKNITKNGPWTDISRGLLLASQSYEEVSGLTSVLENGKAKIYAANNFTPNLYLYDFNRSSWSNIYRGREKFELMENLRVTDDGLTYVGKNGAMILRNGRPEPDTSAMDSIRELLKRTLPEDPDGLLCLAEYFGGREGLNLSELWLASEPAHIPTVKKATSRKGLYVQAHYLKKNGQRESLLAMMEKAGLNTLVIDMKDDWGKLRFEPESDLLKKMGRVGNVLDLEPFTRAMKERGIYLVARLVLFQDRILYQYNHFEYAVKNKSDGGPWQGRKKKKNGTVKTIEEYWVDPYCEKVWEYNVEIARELIRRGFDEIQFDYVRFTTDGDNLGDTAYSFRDKGMDKESAIMSFLNYARENIHAPISIDIYGANGWWRTSARTGQDVELFSKYVDAICPMYYPSHFDPSFEYYEPVDKRPYRIYYYGSLRNYYFTRKSVVVRPYVQTFKMNYLKYDRDYYGPDYVRNEIDGVNDSIDLGYTFWNMGVKYQVLSNVYRIGTEEGKPSGIGLKSNGQNSRKNYEGRCPRSALLLNCI